MSNNNDLVIVYGTLRVEAKTKMSQMLQQQGQFIGTGYFLGKLFKVDGFPGAIESDDLNHKVYGDIFKVTPQLLSSLDTYEECTIQFPQPHDYYRKKIPLYFANNQAELGWVYLYAKATDDLFRIQSGNYLTYQNNTIG